MKLADARRLAVRRNCSIRFAISGGRECVIDVHGIARVPGLAAPPDFDLEAEFARAVSFTIDGQPSRSATRDELASLAGAPAAAAATDEE